MSLYRSQRQCKSSTAPLTPVDRQTGDFLTVHCYFKRRHFQVHMKTHRRRALKKDHQMDPSNALYTLRIYYDLVPLRLHLLFFYVSANSLLSGRGVIPTPLCPLSAFLPTISLLMWHLHSLFSVLTRLSPPCPPYHHLQQHEYKPQLFMSRHLKPVLWIFYNRILMIFTAYSLYFSP